MDQDTLAKHMRLLDKTVLKDNLAKAGLYVLTYEILKNSIIERPRNFFMFDGIQPDDQYRVDVTSRNPNKLIASCLWFQENGAITEQDVQDVLEFREHRNHIAHELPNVILKPEVQVDEVKLVRLFQLLCKLERWWIVQVDLPANPDFDGQEISPEEVQSGSMALLGHAISVVYDLDDLTAKPQ